jgi:uncharacterized protein Smg (DUF494 family)
MKNNLFEYLLDLMEKTLSQLHDDKNRAETQTAKVPAVSDSKKTVVKMQHLRSKSEKSLRVFTLPEQYKLTKASYQFINKLFMTGYVAPEIIELIINRLVFSESRFVSLAETKSTIWNTLVDVLDKEQLAFLEKIIYNEQYEGILH